MSSGDIHFVVLYELIYVQLYRRDKRHTAMTVVITYKQT